MAKKTKKKVTANKGISVPPHPWRLCPVGEHWVRTHPLRIPPSKKNPSGSKTIRDGHCAKNPSGKDQLYPDEILEISQMNFPSIKNKPCVKQLKFGKKGSQYDDLIAGWTQYWNEVLKPDMPLDVNLVKALIASESGFNESALANKKDSNSARGLLQITNKTRKYLTGYQKEIKDHFLVLTKEDLNNPSENICAGVRWLFRKREIASNKLKKIATWEEAVAEFKGLRTVSKKRAQELMNTFQSYYESYKKCEK